MRRLGVSFDELVEEGDLPLLVVDLGRHVHRADVGVVGEVVGERGVVSLKKREEEREREVQSRGSGSFRGDEKEKRTAKNPRGRV